MTPARPGRHRIALGALLLGNAVAFAGVDPPTRWASALLALLLALDLPERLPVPRVHAAVLAGLAALVAIQLVPLPLAVRAAVQPGLRDLLAPGWAPLTVAPWMTLETAAAWAVAVVVALTAARMAATRSGLPALLTLLAACGLVLALLGLAAEAGAPARVLLVRENTGGGSPYGPFVNRNHFALAMELTLPAALALFAAAGRQLRASGRERRAAVLGVLAAGVAIAVGTAALARSHSRGGAVFLIAGAALTAPLWRRRRPGRRWPWAAAVAALLVVAGALAWPRLPGLGERFQELFAIEGVQGNTRWDLWAATVRLWARAPALGVGLGGYRHAIGLEAPPTGGAVVEQAHDDWLEWLATTGVAGTALLAAGVLWLAAQFRPSRLGALRHERRYPLAAAGLALAATALHEAVGFGLQTPLDRYLAGAWIGLVWALRPGAGERPR